jgi:hypothetical protein
MRTPEQIYKLWNNIGDMAKDLDCSVFDLIEARNLSRLPERRHDPMILMRALHKGVRLSPERLEGIRDMERVERWRVKRRGAIADLYHKSGGPAVFLRTTGYSAEQMKIWRKRGRFPVAQRKRLEEFFDSRGLEVPSALFEPIL